MSNLLVKEFDIQNADNCIDEFYSFLCTRQGALKKTTSTIQRLLNIRPNFPDPISFAHSMACFVYFVVKEGDAPDLRTWNKAVLTQGRCMDILAASEEPVDEIKVTVPLIEESLQSGAVLNKVNGQGEDRQRLPPEVREWAKQNQQSLTSRTLTASIMDQFGHKHSTAKVLASAIRAEKIVVKDVAQEY